MTQALGGGFTAVVYEQDRLPGSTWARRTLEIRRRGVVVQRFRSDNEGLGLLAADITSDGVRDVLTFDNQDGSGGVGTYRLYGGPRLKELWVQSHSADTGLVRLEGGALVSWTAVLSSKTRASGSYIHCCWSVWRRSVWRWTGGRLRLVARTLGKQPKENLFLPLPGTFPAP